LENAFVLLTYEHRQSPDGFCHSLDDHLLLIYDHVRSLDDR
jgi:hypothetical protein